MRLEDLLSDDLDRAKALLTKVFSNSLPMSEVLRALNLDFVKKHLDDIDTTDVIRVSQPQKPASSTAGKARVRLSPEQKDEVRDLILSTIQSEEGISTPEVLEKVTQAIPEAQQILVMDFLKVLEKDKLIDSTNTRPKTYSARAQGKKHGEAPTVRSGKNDKGNGAAALQ